MDREAQTITVVLMGDAGCGKTTFLSRLSQSQSQSQLTTPSILSPDPNPPPYYVFEIHPANANRHPHRPSTYRLEIHDNPPAPSTTSTISTSPSPSLHAQQQQQQQQQSLPPPPSAASTATATVHQPDLVVLCYAISSRASLTSLKQKWRREVYLRYGGGEGGNDRLPIMVLGMKRDLRSKGEKRLGREHDVDDDDDDDGREEGTVVDPFEACRVAQEMRCDRYAECSAMTGELMREAFEDLTRLAVLTTTERGGQSEGFTCLVS